MKGTTIKEFKLVERLGSGGWGDVWAAEQQIVKTRVAIKLLLPEISRDEDHVRRFFNEAIAVGKIPHAGIVKIFDVGWNDGRAFLIMELLAGESLATRIRRTTRLALADVIEVTRQIAGVLTATHGAGVIHRDLKPDNVFLIPDAELGERVKVLDFGIAKLGNANHTGTGSLGTPAYMAPEQWHDAATADHRADVYSLGCVMFEMCCGRPPFVSKSTAEMCTMHLSDTAPRARDFAPALPRELDDLIAGMLSKDPVDRPSLSDIASMLDEARPDSRGVMLSPTAPVGAPLATVTSLAGAVMSTPKRERTGGRAALVAGASVAIAATIGVAALTRGDDDGVARSTATPALGLQAIAEYREPTPATIGNHRSEQLWIAAHEDFETACARPNSETRWCAGAKFAAGELALLRDDVAASVAAFRSATMIDPGWATAHVGLSNALAHAREIKPALAAARRAQELEPTWWQAVAATARAHISAKNADDALYEYKRALGMSPPNNAILISEVALAYHYAHQDAEAERLVNQAHALDPSLVSVHVLRAELALEGNRAAEALVEADLALATSPKNGAALIARGDALAMLGRRDDAIATYQRALKHRGGMNLLAISEERLGVIEGALATGALPPPRSDRSPATGDPGSGMPSRSHSIASPGLPSRQPPASSRTQPPLTNPSTATDRVAPAGSPGGTRAPPSTLDRQGPRKPPSPDRAPPVMHPAE